MLCSSQRLAITTSGPPHHFARASLLLGGARPSSIGYASRSCMMFVLASIGVAIFNVFPLF